MITVEQLRLLIGGMVVSEFDENVCDKCRYRTLYANGCPTVEQIQTADKYGYTFATKVKLVNGEKRLVYQAVPKDGVSYELFDD